MLATNLPSAALTLTEAVVLLRLRWQLEPLFKRWKPTLVVDPWRILTEVFAKLVLAVIQHGLLLLGCWGALDRRLVKAALTLLESMGMQVEVKGKGKVAIQSVAPGTQLARGIRVMLELS